MLDALLGAAFGSLLLLGASALYKAVRGREGMGIGDVKMMALVGAFLGLRGAFITILLGTLLGSILGVAIIVTLYLVRWKRDVAERAARRGLGKANALRWAIVSKYQLPLGTFLAIGALLVVFFAQHHAFRIVTASALSFSESERSFNSVDNVRRTSNKPKTRNTCGPWPSEADCCSSPWSASILYLLRRFFQDTRAEHSSAAWPPRPRTENRLAFMARHARRHPKARKQEKELERLHRIEKDRAEQTERLSEEVTRNMPAGLLVVNSTGIISSANPAAEKVLGIRGLAFRRYSEALVKARNSPCWSESA